MNALSASESSSRSEILNEEPANLCSSFGNSESESTSAPGIFLMTNSFETGGSERQFIALARSLQAENYRVHLGCLQPKGPLRKDVGDVLHFGLGGSLFGTFSMRSRFRLARYLQESRSIVAHAFDYYTNLMLIPAAKLARTPVVIGSLRQLGDLLSPVQRRAQLAAFRLSDCVICNSEAAARTLRRKGFSANRVAVIGNGLPPSAFIDGSPPVRHNPCSFRIGMIARMNARSKNHLVLLESVARLRARVPNLELIFVGDGPFRAELETRTAELAIKDIVRFLGDRQDVTQILATLDVTVLPSASESLSNAILESMAARVPVIANEIGGNVELLANDRGMLIPPNDTNALDSALQKLASDAGLRETLSRNARRFAQDNFTIDCMRQKHENLYAELLERKGWRSRARGNISHRSSQRAIRVGIVAASLRYVGGQSVQADLLLKYWRGDPEARVQFIAIDPPFPVGLGWVKKIPGVRTAVRTPLYVRDLWYGLNGVEIVHIFSASYWSFLVAPVPAWLVARLRKKKVLIHYHSGEARDHLRRFGIAVEVLRKMDELVVPSGYLVDVFREFGLPAQSVPNIVDFAQFKFRDRDPLRPYLVCTRGFHHYYRVDLVVKAFADVQRVFPDARLDLAGAGPLEAEIRSLVEKLGVNSVNFLGVISRKNIGKVYDDADIFINASSLDNMPVSVLEAFAAGTPVASTCPEGMSYLVDHERTGLLSPPGDAKALAKNVLRLVQDRQLSRRLAGNAYEESGKYSWAAVREKWLTLYRGLISSS